jgi:hypothetical protein
MTAILSFRNHAEFFNIQVQAMLPYSIGSNNHSLSD